jgi:uncharacterized membrane protein
MISNKQIRANARAVLGGNIFAGNWLLALVIGLIHTFGLKLLDNFAGIGSLLLMSFLTYGYACVFLPIIRAKKEKVEIPAYFGGTEQIGGLVVLSLMTNLFVFLWSLLFIIPGFVKAYAYSMAPYIKYDHPEYDFRTSITESRRMMHGHKWELFCLQLSFIGWIIVGVLCLGVGMLWVTPYMRVAEINFYDDLKKLEDEAYDIPFVNENPEI